MLAAQRHLLQKQRRTQGRWREHPGAVCGPSQTGVLSKTPQHCTTLDFQRLRCGFKQMKKDLVQPPWWRLRKSLEVLGSRPPAQAPSGPSHSCHELGTCGPHAPGGLAWSLRASGGSGPTVESHYAHGQQGEWQPCCCRGQLRREQPSHHRSGREGEAQPPHGQKGATLPPGLNSQVGRT